MVARTVLFHWVITKDLIVLNQ